MFHLAVNNSVYHAILQAVSRKNGLHLMPHMNLDEMAQLLSKTVFRKVFKWYYENFAYIPTTSNPDFSLERERADKASQFMRFLSGKRSVSELPTTIPLQ